MFTGCGIEICPPVSPAGEDADALRSWIRTRTPAGADFVVVACDPHPALPSGIEHHLRSMAAALDEADSRLPVLAEIGGLVPPVAEAARWAHYLGSMGVSGLVLTPPACATQVQSELTDYALAVADAVSVPVTLRNDPTTSSFFWRAETLRRLAAVPNIVGVIEGSDHLGRLFAVVQEVPDDFLILSKDDELLVTRLAMGARAVLSHPGERPLSETRRLLELCLQGDFPAAEQIRRCSSSALLANCI